jgi:hypothetical protein
MSANLKHELFEDTLLNPLRGLQLARDEEFVAAMLLEATAIQPIGIKRLRRALAEASMPRSERMVKEIIRTLRKKHRLPIISRKGARKRKTDKAGNVTRERQDAGYWWCENEAQMLAYFDHASSQPLDSLETLHGMIRNNFPKLAGQLDFTWCGNVDRKSTTGDTENANTI